MSEFNIKDLTEQPEHQQNAELFINLVTNQVSSLFPLLTISAVNQTAEDLDVFPGVLEASKLEGNKDLTEEIASMDSKTDAESAFSTRVFVTITGDKKPLIGKATRAINLEAKKLKGKKTDDSGIGTYGPRESLPKIVGHKPKHEDMPLWQRYLGYKFSE